MKTLMISHNEINCENCSPRILTCGENTASDNDFCPLCQYAYWYDKPSADSPHNTGVKEKEARKNFPLICSYADREEQAMSML